jgi:hypothetical protein
MLVEDGVDCRGLVVAKASGWLCFDGGIERVDVSPVSIPRILLDI